MGMECLPRLVRRCPWCSPQPRILSFPDCSSRRIMRHNLHSTDDLANGVCFDDFANSPGVFLTNLECFANCRAFAFANFAARFGLISGNCSKSSSIANCLLVFKN